MKTEKSIPTSRNWYKNFKSIMDEKVERLWQLTKQEWAWSYEADEKLPFKLQSKKFDAGFSTDWELFECVFWMIWWAEYTLFSR